MGDLRICHRREDVRIVSRFCYLSHRTGTDRFRTRFRSTCYARGRGRLEKQRFTDISLIHGGVSATATFFSSATQPLRSSYDRGAKIAAKRFCAAAIIFKSEALRRQQLSLHLLIRRLLNRFGGTDYDRLFELLNEKTMLGFYHRD